ncbi:NERD domain-containing protein [Synechocystis salina LEGE 06099]|uniref:nuclease-related domain-containing protein n=1 Tax=Synechocystis salina TaxID=945780 RepID=UPI00187F21AA|nr:nuclease-related domain-containing protein [Synechocystis salina]MBE9202751.1 NERD domain-containing protein [Synechocystis salina LEGE 06099]
MSTRSRRPGQNIRELALRRRVKAVSLFVSAIFFLVMPFGIVNLFEKFFKEIITNNPQNTTSYLEMSPVFYLPFLIISLGLVADGIYLLKRANRADQGAKGEEDTSRELSGLKQHGWKIEYGMSLGNRLGDADIVCISPQNRVYVIDVKSHKGKIIANGEKLYRRMGHRDYSFEKDFIAQTMKQALQVKKQQGFKFVTPIIVFSDAKVLISSNQIRKVFIVEKSELASLLKTLG